MQLCIDARTLSCSGIGTFLKNLIPRVAPKDTALIVRPKDVEAYPWLESYSLKLSTAPIYSIREQVEIPALVPRCDLFWSPHYNVPLLPLRAKKRMVTIHDVAHLALKKALNWKERSYAKLLFHQAVSRSNLVVTVSSFSKQELAHHLGFPKEKIHVIYNGVDEERFSKPAPIEELALLKKKHDLPERFFLFVGNLKPHKNLRLILNVYEQGGGSIPIVIVGKITHLRNPDPLVHTIQNSPHLKKQLLLVGEVPDKELPLFYQMATALIFPSLYEGFGLPPLEAMASGCPVIASNQASIPEVCGDGAYLINPRNPTELMQAMSNMLHNVDLRDKLRVAGKQQAARFSWDRTAQQYAEVLCASQT